MALSELGLMGLVVAFASVMVSIAALLAGQILRKTGRRDTAETISWAGCIAAIITTVALTFCCGIIEYCLLTGDFSIMYVLEEHSNEPGALGTLYRISGLWAGRAGSLLFWAWIISIFNTVVAIRSMRNTDALDCMALMVSNMVLAAFVAVCLFSEENMPFAATASNYINADGSLTVTGSLLGMNVLLEHWAQAIHPPTLFIGYAGLTIPFAYAMAALIVNDPSKKWVGRATRYALFSWLFLGVGIGLGSIWAYVVLGWGGYWGWDPVENASLLSWMIALALVHSFTLYRQRGQFKRWSVFCATLAFTFVVTGTFITRSGIVQSVHAFAGDNVSLYLFAGLIICSLAAGLVGLAIRWKSFADAGDGEMQSLASRDAAYYFNNVIMVVFTLLLCYLTVSSALPTWLPFGGQSLSAGTYNAIARPLGIVYCAIMAVCPLLAWGKTDPARFKKLARVPAICAAVLFVVLMAYFFTTLLPIYNATIAAGGSAAEQLANEGPAWYYNGLAILGFAVASMLLFNTLFMIARGVGNRAKATGKNPLATFFNLVHANSSRYGGYIAHASMSIILIGLIGSSMYVLEKTQYTPFDEDAQTADAIVVDDYELRFTESSVTPAEDMATIDYKVEFDVFNAATGAYLGHVDPSVTLIVATQQTKLNASVLGFPTEDLFVVYRGVSADGNLAMDVRVNPLILCVWIGFAGLMLGTFLALIGRRSQPAEGDKPQPAEAKPAQPAAAAEA